MEINLEPDTFKILVFISVVIMILIFLSIIGSSFKNSAVNQKTEDEIVWGNQLLITLLLFSFVFAIFFAFGVGLSTSNFGALVRYKIPCIPFYLSSLWLVSLTCPCLLDLRTLLSP